MLSIERCRRVLGSETALSDIDLERLRDELYRIATVATDLATAQLLSTSARTDDYCYRAAINCLDDAAREEIEERAAIIEYEGNRARVEAERIAIESFTERGNDRAPRDS